MRGEGPLEEEQDEDDGNEEMDLTEFINVYREAIAKTVTQNYAPIYQPGQPEQRKRLPRLMRPPIGAQEHAIRGVCLSLQNNRGTMLVGEMGTGKTYIGAAAAHASGFRNILVVGPPHLVQKWKREIEMTVPGSRAAIVRNLRDLRKLKALRKGEKNQKSIHFTIISREAAKLSYRWQPAYVTRQSVMKNARIVIHCRDCKEPITREVRVAEKECQYCGSEAPADAGTGLAENDDTWTCEDCGETVQARTWTVPLTAKAMQDTPWQCRRCGNQDPEKTVRRLEKPSRNLIACCPGCFQPALDKDEIPISLSQLEKKKGKCNECGGAMWQPTIEGHKKSCRCGQCAMVPGGQPEYKNRRYALADYIKKRMDGFFDLLICDEMHEYKGKGTAQGISAGNMAEACGKSLTLTGTLTGGYASTLFHLLYRFSPEIREEFKHSEEGRWIDRYGFRRRKYRSKGRSDDEPYEHGRGSNRRGYRVQEKETPGLAPGALFHLISSTVFLRLSDVTTELPPYEELIMVQEMSQEEDPNTGRSQAENYRQLSDRMREAMMEALREGSTRLMSMYLQSLLSYPDACTIGEKVTDPLTRRVIADIPPMQEDVNYPKEQALIDMVKEEKKQGRRVIVYVTHTDTRDITPRVQKLLERNGMKTAVMKSESVKSENREAWVNKQVQEGVDALICNPRLVQTGLDLVDFPTLIWYETDYSVYTMRQASRRSWRIGQDQPVKVMFMVYENTIQLEGLKLVAKKMESSLAVEGELPEDGLTSFGDDGQDIVMTLAKQIMNEEGFQTGASLEDIFAKAREVERESELYLVDDSWDAGWEEEPEPEPEERPEPETRTQQGNLFSWAEFMAEPDPEKKGRRKKSNANTGTGSLFQWALEREESRKK